ncbi:hypothetical protein [Flavobacterium cerinum]|uniref:Uncharacterized protein n=1 Tax=Flavobacterium cerinum TaxID=2502784 RepID=A0ABY5IRM7_9FLAO|nr:hypothetical protein [Flavobacterium cerinum]UUC44029.1 hypothetical protein NOX80_10335 [Flavobacterium cerinum]
MKINNSSDFDLDLFFSCKCFPFICHFATGGLKISDENFFTQYHNNLRNKTLNNNPFKFEYRLNPNLEKIIANKREIDPEFDFENYTRDFIKYAQFGFFSFDRTYLDAPDSNLFHLVAYPIIDNHNRFEMFQYFKEDYFHFLYNYKSDFNFDMNRSYTDIHDFINENFKNSIKIKM